MSTATAVPPKGGAKSSTTEKGRVLALITLTGLPPGLLMNPMSDTTLDHLLHGTRPQLNKDRKPDDIAKDRIYLGEHGVMGIPTMNVIAALKHAGRAVKMGRKGISTATSTTLFSFAEFPDEFTPFNDLDEHNGISWVVDKRRGVMKTGPSQVAVAIVRPKFPAWNLTVKVILNEQIVGRDTLEKLFHEAGTNAGLGDFRPSKGGPFGRFAVTGTEYEPVEQ